MSYKPRPHRAICDICNSKIVGVRYKCLNCSNFDLCQDCERNHHLLSLIYVGFGALHNPRTHSFIKCWHPLRRLSNVPRERLCFVDPFVRDPDRPGSDSDESEDDGEVAVTTTVPKQCDGQDLTLHEMALCSMCGIAIVGRRYSCLFCRFDLCETCEGKSGHQSILSHAEIRKDRDVIQLRPTDEESDPVLECAHVLMKTPFQKVFKSDAPRSEAFRMYLEFDEEEPDIVAPPTDETVETVEVEGESSPNEAPAEETRKPLFRIRKMRWWDISEVMAIEKTSFSLPWRKAMFRRYVDSMEMHDGKCYAHILQIGSRIAAYGMIQVNEYKPEQWDVLRKEGLIDYDPSEEPEGDGEGPITITRARKKPFFAAGINGAVHPDFRRKGVAKALMAHNLAFAKKIGCLQLTLRVAARNYPAQRLYSFAGFSVRKWIPEYFEEDEEIWIELKGEELEGVNEDDEDILVIERNLIFGVSKRVWRKVRRRDREFRLGDATGAALQMTIDLVKKNPSVDEQSDPEESETGLDEPEEAPKPSPRSLEAEAEPKSEDDVPEVVEAATETAPCEETTDVDG